MQSIDRLPRLIARPRQDALGGLRPGEGRDVPPAGVARDRMWGGSSPSGFRDGPRRMYPGRWLTAILLVGAGIASVTLPAATKATIRHYADALAVKSGFEVDHVAVMGYRQTSFEAIAETLDLDDRKSLIGFSAADVRARLRKLPWIKSARVVHILPDTVSIEVSERVPFAVWQRAGRTSLIDHEGRVLGDVADAGRSSLPLVIGNGAATKAADFLAMLAKRPLVARHVQAVIRVADRRWTLALKSGNKILLPEQGLSVAFNVLEKFLTRGSLSRNSVALIDLRIPERPTFRLTLSAAKALAEHRRSRRSPRKLATGSG